MTATKTEKQKKSWLQRVKDYFYRYDDYPKSIQKGKYPFILLGITIPIIHFFVFYLGVNFMSILLAFQETHYESGVGEVVTWTFENFPTVFKYLTTGGNKMYIALRNTLQLFVVDVAMMIPIFIYAYCFSRNMKGAKVFRVIMYLPTIISGVAFSTMVTSILQENIGALDVICRDYLGFDLPPLFSSDENAWGTVLAYCVWAGVYANLLLYEGAIRRVPTEVVEAAMIDGANTGTILRKIVLPMVWGTLSTILIIKVSGLFTISGPILVLTGGMHNTQTLSFWFYEEVAVGGSYHIPAAGGIVFTLIGLPIVWGFRALVNRFSNNLEY